MSDATDKAQIIIMNLTKDLDGVHGVVPGDSAVEIHVDSEISAEEVDLRIDALTDEERAAFDTVDITYNVGE